MFGRLSVQVLDRTKREGVGYDEMTRFLRWSATPDLLCNTQIFGCFGFRCRVLT